MTSSSEKIAHTPEPWTAQADRFIRREDQVVNIAFCCGACGVHDLGLPDDDEACANQRRIVDCVNACAGIDFPIDRIKTAREALQSAVDFYEPAENPRNRSLSITFLKDALKGLGGGR